MRYFVLSLLTAAAVLAAIPALEAQPAGGSVWSGVFTAAQATRGQALFNDNCAKCHGPDLTGSDMAPQLAGSSFLSNWNGENVGNLVERIRTTMPADDPGKLSRVSATDLAAYILSSNQIPSGSTELPPDQQVQTQIRIDALKPN